MSRITRISIIFLVVFGIVTCVMTAGIARYAIAAEPLRSAPAESTAILAPEGLEERERANLERTYRFQYRNKQRILSPNLSPTLSGGIPIEQQERAETEQERYYRYFAVAMELKEEGRFEEAAEILTFLSDRNPGDAYVKRCLDQIRCKNEFSTRRWQTEAGDDSAA